MSPGACGHLPSFRGSAPVANGVRRSLEAQAERWLRRLAEPESCLRGRCLTALDLAWAELLPEAWL